ncbi:hypothetical protein [Clostridium sp.]|uniref:hypothetical protein n=1 Tax=Clostridium sp. TaxID=1506 RepID=UPI0025C1E3A9|nr:hypothetical protein [Clostridium sp.]
MTTPEMHVWFRQYAQQMGMQNVRAILPEQIDNLINTSTRDIIDEVIKLNVGTTNDRVITDNAKIANINALRTLYKVKTINIENSTTIKDLANKPYIFDSQSLEEVPLYFVDFSIRYSDRILDSGNQQDIVYTRWFPIRIVDDSYLADILNDWVLAPRMRTPVMVIYSYDGNNQHSTFELYVGENEESSISAIAENKWIGQIRCSYIKTPNKVAYLSDIGGTNVDSDLPEQLQIPMLKHAVDLYRVSINGSLYANQQNNQQNQQEIARNNVRPDNEGYQS